MISIVIPTLNRGRRLLPLFEAISNTMTEDYEIIVVDDGSCDHWYGELKQMMVTTDIWMGYGKIKAVFLNQNVGQQNATLAGIRVAEGDYVVTIDDDLQYNPNMIHALYDELQKGYDVVYGVPRKPKKRHYRSFGTGIKEWVFWKFLSKPKNIRLTSFRMMNKAVADYVARDQNKRVYVSARLLQMTQNIGQVAIVYDKEQNKRSRYRPIMLMQIVWYLVVHYSGLFIFKPFQEEGQQYEIKEMLICD